MQENIQKHTDRWLQDAGGDGAECTALTNRWDNFNALFNPNPQQEDKLNHPSVRPSIRPASILFS